MDRQLEELSRTIDRFEKTVARLTRAVDRLAERQLPRRSALLDLVGSGGMEEAEAVRIAIEAAHRARSELPPREPEAPEPDADEVRGRREERRRRESA